MQEIQDSPTSKLAAGLARLQALLVVLYAASIPLSLTATWIILCVALVVAVAQMVVEGRGIRSVITFFSTPLTLPIAAFAVVVTVSGLVNGGPSEAWQSFFSLKAFIAYFWAYKLFADDRALLLRAIQILLLVGAAAGIFGTIQQLFNFHPFGYQYLQGTGFLGGPMAFAGEMQILSMLALALLLKGGFRQFQTTLARTPVFVFIVAANCLGVLFASERSAWLGAAAGVFALSALLGWRSFGKTILVMAVVSAACWATVPVVRTRLASLENWQQDVSVRARFHIWQESVKLFRNHPLLGVGIRKFPHFDIPEAIVPGHSRDLNHAHNNYLHILATTGVIGLTAYLWLWIVILSRCISGYRQGLSKPDEPENASAALGVFGATVALMVAGIFEYNFGTAQVRLAQWFVLAMLNLKKAP